MILERARAGGAQHADGQVVVGQRHERFRDARVRDLALSLPTHGIDLYFVSLEQRYVSSGRFGYDTIRSNLLVDVST